MNTSQHRGERFFSKIVQYKQMDAQALEHSGLKLYEIDALNS